MKRFILVVTLLFASMMLASCREADLKILIPTDYLDEGLVSEFQKLHNVRVKTISFPSNEAAIARLKRETFDLMVPSDYGLEQLIAENLVLPLEWNKLDFDKETHFAEPLMDLISVYEHADNPVPLLDYMVPYFWGNLGILYNASKEGLSDILEEEGWGVFLRNDLKKVVYDSSRDAYLVALKYLGYGANTDDADELREAENFLKDVADTKNVYFLTDQLLDDMQTLKYDIALTYNGDAVYVKERQDKVGYYVPNSGTNVFVDGIAIPKKSRNIDLAYKFINFVSEHDNALINAIDVSYVSAIKSVYEHSVNDEDAHFYPYRDIYTLKFNENDEIFRYIPSVKSFMDSSWARIRAR